MSEAKQALAFIAGANSIFTGDKLPTAANVGDGKDTAMLGLSATMAEEPMQACRSTTDNMTSTSLNSEEGHES